VKSDARQIEFERVALPHTRSLLRVARRLTLDADLAEDLVQDTLLNAWRGFAQFEAGTNARAWLFRILFNNFYARARKPGSGAVRAPLGPGVSVVNPVSEQARAAVSALDELPEEQKSVLLLGIVEGLTCREMAEVLGLPIGTVMSRLSRGREAVRSRLTAVHCQRSGVA
jgi:RNA polymerase sigma-70 factor (ECF subfamily)